MRRRHLGWNWKLEECLQRMAVHFPYIKKRHPMTHLTVYSNRSTRKNSTTSFWNGYRKPWQKLKGGFYWWENRPAQPWRKERKKGHLCCQRVGRGAFTGPRTGKSRWKDQWNKGNPRTAQKTGHWRLHGNHWCNGHGRFETREYYIEKNISWMTDALKDWICLHGIGVCRSTVEENGSVTSSVSYAIFSDPEMTAEKYGKYKRATGG